MPAATNGNDSEHSADQPGDKPPLKNPSHPWNPAGDPEVRARRDGRVFGLRTWWHDRQRGSGTPDGHLSV